MTGQDSNGWGDNRRKIYSARRLPNETGIAAWKAILPAWEEYPPLTENITADFAIIGAGFAGLSAALRLQQLQPTARIVILEAQKLAEGANGRNSGFMVDIPHNLQSTDYASDDNADKNLLNLNRHAIEFANQAVQKYDINAAFFDPSGKVNGAVTQIGDAHNHSFAKHLTALGEPCEMLDSQAMYELTGSHYYLSGLYTKGAVTLQPAGYIQSLAAGLMRDAQVTIYPQSAVLEFRQHHDGWKLKTPKGTVEAGKIILANNGHLESFGFARQRLMHVFLYGLMTENLDDEALKLLGGAPRWGVTPSDPLGTTMRKIDTEQGGNRIITRSCVTFHPNMQTNQRNLTRTAKELRRRFDVRFPQLQNVKMEYSWSGHLCLTRDDLSIVREIEDNVFTACCQNGLGVSRGTLTGIAAAEMACGATSHVTEFFGDLPLPKKILPAPISSIGANIYLRFQEWRTRNE